MMEVAELMLVVDDTDDDALHLRRCPLRQDCYPHRVVPMAVGPLLLQPHEQPHAIMEGGLT
jgi:hypothetical protein